MMKTLLRFATALSLIAPLPPHVHAQTGGPSQGNLVFAGLRSISRQGAIVAVKVDGSGNLILLLNQGDGVRLLKTDSAASTVLAQAQLGSSGDAGVGMALDPGGSIYVAGTSSGSLTGTAGAAIANRTDGSLNSFVARFDGSLKPVFVSFTGGSRIAAAAVAATADAVFVTGTTYATNLPVTSNGIQQAPAPGSFGNGFVEKFSGSGTTLLYATYLTGASGDTSPAAIVADAADNAYVAGATSASGFPTVAALVPTILSNPSGFLLRLSAAGDGFAWSTFVPGAGLTSLALDSTGATLLVSGAVAPGQFPVDTVTLPLVPAIYQALLRVPLDGSSVLSSTLLAPGTQSIVAAAPNAAAWVDGTLSAPLLPLPALQTLGGGFAVRVPAGLPPDQAARFGGLPDGNASFASLPLSLSSLTVDAAGEPIVAGTVQPTASSAALSTQTYDLPLLNGPTAALPSRLADAKQTAATCNGSLCAGAAGYLAKLNPNASSPALSFSADDLPAIVLRNQGSAEADHLQVATSAGTLATNCPPTLFAGAECDLLLSGGTAGTLTAQASNAAVQTLNFAAYGAPANTIAFFPKELDFGIQTSASPSGARTITVTNLGTTSQTFTSALDATANPKGAPASPFAELLSDCTLAGSLTRKVLAPGGTCHITIGFSAPNNSASDASLTANWSIGTRDVLLTGYSQAASLSVSSATIEFGTQFSNGIHLPRFLYLSNASGSASSHAALSLPANSPFTLTDSCPSTLTAASVCRIRIDYRAAQSTSVDTTTLALDGGLSVVLSGKTLPPPTVGGTTVNPNLSVSPGALSFATAVPVTGVSGAVTVTIANSGTSTLPLSLSLSGDFTDVTGCGPALAAGQSCSVAITFVPSQPGPRQGLLAIAAGSGFTPTLVALNGTAAAILPPNNGTLDSGSVAVGQPVTQFYKVAQSFSTLTAAAGGAFRVVLVEDAGFGPGQPPPSAYAASFTGSCLNCFLGVRFLPAGAGPQNSTLALTAAPGGSPYVLSLTGIGVPLTGLQVTPALRDFGAVPVHSASGTQTFTLTNLSAAGDTLPLSSPAVMGDFAVNAAAPGSCGPTLVYGASCTVSVQFRPSATGVRSGALTFSSGSVSAVASLAGTGIVDPGLAIDPLALIFNDVPGPSAMVQSVVLSNTGTVALQVGPPSTATAQFPVTGNCGALPPGATCTLAVTYLPGSAFATDTLSIPVASTTGPPASATYTVALSGTYTSATAGLQLLPGTAQYGPLAVGTLSPARQFTVNNLTGKSLTLNVSMPRQFLVVGAPCAGLAPNASCTFSAAFSPVTAGDIPGTILAQATPSDGSPALTTIAYAEGFGTGTGAVAITSGQGGLIVGGVFNFGQVTSGQTSTELFLLTNRNPAGGQAVTVRRVSSAPPFLSTTSCGGPLAAGASCTVSVTYAPSNQVATGSVSPPLSSDAGSLVVESEAPSSPDILNLAGKGVAVGVGSPANTTPLATFSLSQGSLSFPQTAVGNNSPAQTVTLSNTGTATIHVSSMIATPDFTLRNACATVAVGASCSFTVAATPQSAGQKIASVEINSDAAVSLEFVSLLVTGAPSPLTLAPQALDFGAVQVGSSATLPVQVTNTATSAVVFAGLAASGDYAVSGNCPGPGASLAAASSCTVQVIFRPSSAGGRPGTLSLSSSASTNPLTVPLSGIGTQAALTVSPSVLAFGSIAVGVPAKLSITLLNTGSAPLTGVALAASGDYAVTIPCPQPVLAPGTSCTAQITFTPSAAGPRSGNLVITSSDPSSPALVPLTGSGVVGGSFSLTVDGGAASSVTVKSGAPATFHLALTPSGGFSGTVALTCAPVQAGQYASCALLPATLTLSGAQSSLATINTVTSIGGNARLSPSYPTPSPRSSLNAVLACLLCPGLLTVWRGRRELRRRRSLLLAMLFASFALFSAAGCGSSGDLNIRYTPAGTYQYQVTASSTTGVPVTQTVTLNLTVTPR